MRDDPSLVQGEMVLVCPAACAQEPLASQVSQTSGGAEVAAWPGSSSQIRYSQSWLGAEA
jgi:hypothetical protein